MNTRSVCDFRLMVPQILVALLFAPQLSADTAFSFQNGVNSYSGAKDISINTQYSQYNGGNGTQWRGDPELGCYTTTGADSYTVRYLLKFGGLSIPPGSQVVSATLTIALDSWESGPGNITGFYLKNAWDASFSQLGWLHRNATSDWAGTGASSSGVDTVAGKSFQVPALRPVGAQKVTIPLDASVVQAWIDSPAANQGIMLVNNNPGEIIRPVSTVGKQSLRPKLTIVIAGATSVQVSVSPTSATLQPGQTKPFTATVTGSSNTAVTWTATGGTISSSGVFTAGSTTGSNFSVTATSVADATKSASAGVTIQPAPVVSVTISPTSATLQPGQTKPFTATVTGSSNTAVTWSATGGTISTSGVFTAGSTTGSNFSVTATSVADSTKSASASVTIQPAPVVSVTISPTSATLQPGQTKPFTATVTGSSNTAVTWSATGGTISSGGVFTAGSTTGSNFSVTATSVADSTKSASAGVTIQAPPTVQVSMSPLSATVQPGHTQPFTATVTGSSNTSVTWTATGGAISSSGVYTAGQTTGNFSVTATSVADPSRSATASVRIDSTSSLPPVPRQFDGAYVVVQSPVSGMHFTAPATIRIYADPFDSNAPDPDALTVNFLMNGQSIGTFTGSGSQNGYFALTANNVAAGIYSITAQITTAGHGVVTSAPVTVFVDNPAPSSGPVFNLSGDVVLSGSQNTSFAGTSANRCTINGNGFQIRSTSGFSGSLIISNCNIRGLGTATNPSIDVTVNGSGSVQLTGNVFDTFGTVSIGANDQAQALVRNNEFRENTLVPVTSLPTEYSNATLPVFFATGNSSAQQFFQGNNVGLSTVVFHSTRNWLIGGNTNAESNVLMGVRCGFTIDQSSNMVLRGNYSQHNYPHRFSQGENFQLDGDGFLAEHNVIRSSSWPVRGMGGELRYNLIDASGNSDQVVQGPMSNANIHHNIFVFSVSQTLYSPGSGVHLLYNVDGVQFHNNVMDGGGTLMSFYGSPIAVTSGSFIASLRNNVFYNFAGLSGGPILGGELGESTTPALARLRYSDYNDFFNPDAPNPANYGLGVVGLAPGSAGYGLHDLGGFNGHANPKFAQPTAIPFPFRPEDIWSRTTTVSDVLSAYRAMYSPAAGSPLIGAGDPQDGPGGNIGAVGNGEPADQFGLFGNGAGTPPPPPPPPPSAPVISSFTASPQSVQAGQSATLNWSVTGATTLSVTPGPGTVSGSSTTVTPGSTTTYTLTATNSGGSVTATTTVTVTTVAAVGVALSPGSTSLFTGGTQQFTATVTNAANTAVTWSATGGTITSAGFYTAGATPGTFSVTATSVQDSTKSATAAITITAQSAAGAHPRIILDASTLATLRTRAQARTPEWTRLKSFCDSYTGGGTVNFPGGNGYPDPPNVGEGYQGSGYIDVLISLGLCYHTTIPSDPTTAAKYGTKGVAILMAMSDPNHQMIGSTPVWDRDDGYGMRNYGVAMGIGYDWFHDLMTAAQLTQIQTALSHWINGFENDPSDNFEYEHPQGNYFAGYYAAKCMAALAVQGDSPLGDTWWNDWYNHQHLQRVAPYYTANLTGGGWLEGFAQYGILSSRNQSLPALAVKTAKGIDIINNPANPYTYPLDNARYLMSFTWPTHDIIDDRGELYSTGDPNYWPGTASLDIYRFYAGFLAMWGDPAAPMMHKYARDVEASLNALGFGGTTEWIDFLFWDPSAPEASDYSSLPRSYLAPGTGGVAARSDWSPSATFLSFLSGPYINNPGAGHEAFDKGSPAMERNRNPFLVNPAAWLSHEPNGDPGWTLTYNDRFGNWDVDHTLGNRTLYNTFQVRHLDAQGNILDNYGEWALQRTDGVRTKIGRYEDGGSYVLAVGQFLEDMYRPFQTICAGQSPITSWSRQIVYLRPSQFVVYDRTGICDKSLDQYLAFHFPANPVEVTPPAPGLHRLDVSTTQFAGSMTTILPANAAITTTDRLSSDSATWNKLWRTEIRAPGAPAAAHLWMTVFDLAPSSAQVAAATGVTVSGGSAVGALLASPAGNSVVISGTAPVGTAIAGPISYTVPAAATRHVITDLAPSAGYTVSVSVSGGNHIVTVAPGGSFSATANAVLSFSVTAGGLVQP